MGHLPSHKITSLNISLSTWKLEDLPGMIAIWNEIVEQGEAFPQENRLTLEEGQNFFASQSYTGIAKVDNRILGLYILHPNNLGRCGHIANASYAVARNFRHMGIGRLLVEHSLKKGHELGFRIMQFNAVVESNIAARSLYESLGFQELGHLPGCFRRKDGVYEDARLYWRKLGND